MIGSKSISNGGYGVLLWRNIRLINRIAQIYGIELVTIAD
ncbi:Uncharacterised protein [Proteus mirabilis]|uniref:Uncharacterized protein n=1 Tax=Proteus mirabilis TaxID=584 RepID=A0A379GHX3_PROMI|nr:Uncharacterised protein [Proteus mirabilis]